MSFEEDDTVVLHDQHSEYDGDTGTITQVMESMFGDANYTISFEDGQEAGVPEDSLELVEDDEAEDEDEPAAEDDA
jgi:predicted N-acetyltransferase YhbS